MADIGARILDEMVETARSIPFSETTRLAATVMGAPRVYIQALGRCGHIMRTFAIRLAQMGISVHVVGEPSALAARPGDLLVIGSGTGETGGSVAIAQKARDLGLDLLVMTASPQSRLAAIAGIPIILPGVSKDDIDAQLHSIQPPGSLFEQMLFCFLEQTIFEIAQKRDPGYAVIRRQHANLE